MNEQNISGAALSALKGKAQLLEPCVRLGKSGITPEFLRLLLAALEKRQLVKIRFEGENKDKKKELSPEIAVLTKSQLIQRVGNTATYYRAQSVGS